MDFDLIKATKVKELKIYLQMPGLKVSGRKEELVARVFAAKEKMYNPSNRAKKLKWRFTKYTYRN